MVSDEAIRTAKLTVANRRIRDARADDPPFPNGPEDYGLPTDPVSAQARKQCTDLARATFRGVKLGELSEETARVLGSLGLEKEFAKKLFFEACNKNKYLKDENQRHKEDVFEKFFAEGKKQPIKYLSPEIQDNKDKDKEGAADQSTALMEMNRIDAAVSVAGKFRVMTFVPHPLYPLQSIAQFSSKEDFCNHVVEPRILVTQKTRDGETRQIKKPRGQWWLNQPDHRRFDDIDFVPGSDSPIEINDTGIPGRIIRKANMFSGFSVLRAEGDCQLSPSMCSRTSVATSRSSTIMYWPGWPAACSSPAIPPAPRCHYAVSPVRAKAFSQPNMA